MTKGINAGDIGRINPNFKVSDFRQMVNYQSGTNKGYVRFTRTSTGGLKLEKINNKIDVPAENSEAVILKVLEANCGFKKTGGATLSINPETGCFELARYFALEILEPATLLAHLERFALALVEVREMLKEGEMEDAESRKEDAVDDASSSSDPLEMGSQGFVRV